MAYVRWSQIRDKHIAAAGPERVEALVESLKILVDSEAMAAIRESERADAEWTTGEEMAAIMAQRLGR